MSTSAAIISRKTLDLPAPVANVEDGCRALGAYGVCVHKGGLSPDQVRLLLERLSEQAELEREAGVALISDQSYTGKTWYGGADGLLPRWQGVPLLVNKGRVFIDHIVKNPVAHAYCRSVFQGAPYHLSASSGMIVRKGAEPMALHADQQYLPMKTELPVHLNVFYCLSDFEADMGATRVVPGSHLLPPPRMGHTPERGAYCLEETETIPVECAAGDVIIWESRLWHQSGASTSEKTRYSISSVWSQAWVKPIDNLVQCLQDDVYQTLSKDELELLQFKVDAAGRFGPRYPGDRQATNRAEPFVPELRRGGDKRPVPAPEPRTNVDTFEAHRSGGSGEQN